MRLRRQSGYYSAEFRESEAAIWQQMATGGTSFTEPVSIAISAWSAGTGSERTIRFHDFAIESGTCVA
jgi:hypothetical protein